VVDDRYILDRFALNWNMQIRESYRKIRKPKKLKVMDYYDDSMRHQYIEAEELDCYEVTIPKNDLHALAQIEQNNKHLERSMVEKNDYILQLKRRESIEIKARANNPAVKKAWDNYCTLMNMVYNDYVDRY
jgi:hypothetical protein